MILSLDSNVVVDVLRGAKAHVRDRMGEAVAAGFDLVVSTIVVQELVLGAHLSTRPDIQLAALYALLKSLRVEPWTWDDALAAGRLRAERERMGRRLPSYDTLIAAQALARGWTLVTGNLRDFEEIDGLSILDWADPAGPVQYSR